jgi:UDP-N-acetylglucosamine--N-acetylmuramyl-(pentapeptide) pyrophosphoryl-undecaprenol N-acetylglucosamine transferase
MTDYAPVAAVGFGSYVSLPSIYTANRFGCPIILHEQNAVMGRANRYLAARADAIALSFKPTARIPAKSLDITHDIGNPVRHDIQQLYHRPYTPPAGDQPIELLITGGSQGASLFSTVIPAAIDQLPYGLQSRLRITHQCRPNEIDGVMKMYQASQVQANVIDFITDMASAMDQAHLIIGRAGAGTVSEIACAKRPSVLIPLASAIHNHQAMNARVLADNGAAEILVEADLTSAILSDRLEHLLSNPDNLSAMSKNAKKIAHPHAAKRLANLVTAHLEMAQKSEMPEMAGASA